MVDELADWERVLPALKRHLDEVYRIGHVTLQPEPRATPDHDCGELKHHGHSHGDDEHRHGRAHRHRDEQAD